MNINRIKILSCIIFLIIVVISLFFKNKNIMLGLILGSFFITSNFIILEYVIRKLVGGQNKKKIKLFLLYSLKVLFLFGGSFFILKYIDINKLL
jgi:hypothetical protein